MPQTADSALAYLFPMFADGFQLQSCRSSWMDEFDAAAQAASHRFQTKSASLWHDSTFPHAGCIECTSVHGGPAVRNTPGLASQNQLPAKQTSWLAKLTKRNQSRAVRARKSNASFAIYRYCTLKGGWETPCWIRCFNGQRRTPTKCFRAKVEAFAQHLNPQQPQSLRANGSFHEKGSLCLKLVA